MVVTSIGSQLCSSVFRWQKILILLVTLFVCEMMIKMNITSSLRHSLTSFARSDIEFPGLERLPEITIELTPDMGLTKVDAKFYSFISHLHVDCKDRILLGNQHDGGWGVCIVGPYRPQRPCLVYSFGIGIDWSFDDAAVREFGCTVRAFDPSIANTTDHIRGSNIYFYTVGIASKNGVDANGWKMKTLPTLLSHLNDTDKTIDYMKMDVEGGEWDVLRSFIDDQVSSDVIRYRVKQLAFEIHLTVRYPLKAPTERELYREWQILSEFEKRFDFRRWWFSTNEFTGYRYKSGTNRSRCYEMVYINSRFLSHTEMKNVQQGAIEKEEPTVYH